MHDLALDFIQHVKRVQKRHDHETDFYRLATSLGLRVAPGTHNAIFPGDPPTITIQYGLYAARYAQRIGMHEIAHYLLWDSGIDQEVQRLHGDWPGAEETLELLAHLGATILHLPDPLLKEARFLHGDEAAALLHLYQSSNAGLGEVLRRWVHAEEDASRAAWTSAGPYINDIATQNARLPFWKWSRVPEVDIMIPEATLLAVPGRGRVLGAVGW